MMSIRNCPKRRQNFFILITAILLGCTQPSQPAAPYVIGIGSCNHQGRDQSMWYAINQNEPNLFIWLGDIVYGDTHDMRLLKSYYEKTKAFGGYDSLRSYAEIIGVWDDHDYGWNDAGKAYSKKDSSKMLLMDFLDIDPSDPVRSREGFYTSNAYHHDGLNIKVILLDARYFRDTLVADNTPGRRYGPNPDGDILGEAQWEWLESELQSSQADVHIIGCGIQFIPEEHGWEKWANFPKSRTRFFDLINQYRPKGLLLISGDRHIAEMSKIELAPDYAVYELTTSGLTHTWSNMWEEANRYRLDDKIVKRNFGIIRVSKKDERPILDVEVRGLGDSLFYQRRLIFP